MHGLYGSAIWLTFIFYWTLLISPLQCFDVLTSPRLRYKLNTQSRLNTTSGLISNATVVNKRHCSQRCSQNANCVSFNVIQGDAGIRCELFNDTDVDAVVEDADAAFWGKWIR